MKYDEPNIFSHAEKYDNLFIKVPDELIFDKDADRFTLVVYSWLGFSRDYYDFAYIDIGKLFECYFDELPNRKPNLYERIVNALSYLEENDYLKYNRKNVEDFKYNNVSLSYISASLTDKFDPSTDFTIFYYRDFKKIMLNSKPKTLDLNTLVFLYACSFMNFGRNDQPRVFYKSVEGASEELGIRRCTIGDALIFLSSAECGVLKRCETFLTQPNIYVLNDDTADAEIKKALSRLDVNVMPNKSVQKEDDVVDSTHEVKEPTVAKNETTEEEEEGKTDFEVHEDIPDYFKEIEWDDDNEVPSSYEEYKHEPTEELNDSPTNSPKPRVVLDIFKEDEDDNTEFLADKYYGRNIDYEKEFGSIGEEKSYFDSESFVEDDNFDGLF